MAGRSSPEKALEMLEILRKLYPNAHCALIFDSPFQLLVATILSAQCTDVQVNRVTPKLFTRYPDPLAMMSADLESLENLIRSTGFFRNKARNLIACARLLVDQYQGRVPDTLEELVRLPGVGRKTANVVLGNAFGIPGMVVDTHVKRLSRRMGWSDGTDPEKIEQQLCELLPEEDWTLAGHLLILHGREICKAPVPLCSICPLQALCPKIGVDKAR
ncbi:MAG: endonuclease III [Syntrophotaleaceae bacterium]